MKPTVQARLDRRSQMALERLMKRLGWSASKVMREGVRLLDACYSKSRRRKIVGTGRFASGILDLGSNKQHLKGYGWGNHDNQRGRVQPTITSVLRWHREQW